MPLSLQHRHAVRLADRTRDVRTITTVVTEVLAANPELGGAINPQVIDALVATAQPDFRQAQVVTQPLVDFFGLGGFAWLALRYRPALG